jgi:hypothetical protein
MLIYSIKISVLKMIYSKFCWIKLRKDGPHNLYSSENNIRVTEEGDEMGKAYRIYLKNKKYDTEF